MSARISFVISCKLSPRRQLAFNIKAYFLGKNRKKISVCRLLNMLRKWEMLNACLSCLLISR